MLLRHKEILGELQPDGDVRSDKHASVEVFGPMSTFRATRLPAFLRGTFDLFALSRTTADDEQGGGKHDRQAAYTSCSMSLG